MYQFSFTDSEILWPLLILFGAQQAEVTACNPGFFGPHCWFRCHCSEYKCTDKGTCLEPSRCIDGYFGPGCQYVDLIDEFGSVSNPNWLVDGDHATCNLAQESIVTVNLEEPVMFTWLRVRIRKLQQTMNPSLEIKLGKTEYCNNTRLFKIDDNTMDASCDSRFLIRNFTLQGNIVPFICHLYLSGGRNVAFMGNVYPSYAIDVVDGTVSSKEPYTGCLHEDKDILPHRIAITFNTLHTISKVRLIPTPGTQLKLKHFRLQTLNRDHEQFVYDEPGVLKDIYSVQIPEKKLITRVLITALSISEELELCEVEVFGDMWCDDMRYGLTCSDKCKCPHLDDICHPATGACTDGCGRGKYGLMCSSLCYRHCLNNTCKFRTGKCTCQPGYEDDGKCETECQYGYFGLDCSSVCSDGCKNVCSKVDGSCDVCKDGYYGKGCEFYCSVNCYKRLCAKNGTCFACAKGVFGPRCENLCSRNCLKKKCNETTGGCLKCISGHFGTRRCHGECRNTVLDCSKTCPDGCLNNDCDEISGRCRACWPGYTGNECLPDEYISRVWWLVILSISGSLLLIVVICYFRARIREYMSSEGVAEGS